MKLKHRRTKELLCPDNTGCGGTGICTKGLNWKPHAFNYATPAPRGFWVSELKEGASLSEIKNTDRGARIWRERDRFSLGCDEFEMLLGYHRYSVEQRVNETGA